jgi:hypothetical protein
MVIKVDIKSRLLNLFKRETVEYMNCGIRMLCTECNTPFHSLCYDKQKGKFFHTDICPRCHGHGYGNIWKGELPIDVIKGE